MRTSLVKVTERGEGVVTAQLLLDTMMDAIYQAVSVEEFDTSTCSYLVGALNQMARCGLLEEAVGPKPGPGKSPAKMPSEPPSFFKDWAPRPTETPDVPEV